MTSLAHNAEDIIQSAVTLESLRYEGIVFLGECGAVVAGDAQFPRQSWRAPACPLNDHDSHPPVFDWLCQARGLNPRLYRSNAIRRRERACARALGAATVADAARRAAAIPEVVDKALNAVLIGVTSFFREPAAFEALARETKTVEWAGRERVDVLSIACSDGCELYSAGMQLAETCGLDRLRLLGIDCRPAAIRKAEPGVYSVSELARMSPSRRSEWFEECGKTAQVRASLRARASWCVGDAFDLEPELRADVILCRNLAIYLRADAVQALWQSIADRLRPGGLLMVGKAERVAHIPSLRCIGPCLYRKSEVK